MALTTNRVLARYEGRDWVPMVRRALAPIAIGFMLASGVVMTRAAYDGVVSLAIVAVVASFLYLTRMSPAWGIAGGLVVGILGHRLHLMG